MTTPGGDSLTIDRRWLIDQARTLVERGRLADGGDNRRGWTHRSGAFAAPSEALSAERRVVDEVGRQLRGPIERSGAPAADVEAASDGLRTGVRALQNEGAETAALPRPAAAFPVAPIDEFARGLVDMERRLCARLETLAGQTRR